MLKLATKFAPTARSATLACEAGFRHAEIWTDERVLARSGEMAELLSAYPLAYALHFPNLPLESSSSLEKLVGLYQALGCQAVVIHQPLADAYGQDLARLDPSLHLAVENHELDRAGFQEWAETNAGLTLDVEHLWQLTLADAPLEQLLENVDEFLARYGSKLRHVHMPGYQPGQATHRPMYCSRDMVFGVLSLLDEFGFGGLVVSELETEYQNAAELRMDVLLAQVWEQGRSEAAALRSGRRNCHAGTA